MEILRVENLNFTYPEKEKKVLENISFDVNSGDFIVLAGATGSGKSTLLKCIKPELKPYGQVEGKILFNGLSMENTDKRVTASQIGFVMQKPEQQIVCDKVWHEMAFGLENMGLTKEVIRSRVAETASFFGIDDWFYRDTAVLSGGQKQLLNLAAVMVMNPSLLLLDEPAAMLDPIAASDFLATVARLNREMGVTVIMIEHNLEEVMPFANRLIALEEGKVICDAEISKALGQVSSHKVLSKALPVAVKLYGRTKQGKRCPISISEGRTYLSELMSQKEMPINQAFGEERTAFSQKSPAAKENKAFVEVKGVFARYKKELPDVLNNLSFSVKEGEIFCMLGGNGSGKSTVLKLLSGILKPYAGSICIDGERLNKMPSQKLYNILSMLPQDVQTMFLKDTVEEELKGADISGLPFDFGQLLTEHPYDLSGGEQELLALAIVLKNKPKLLLLDEPTKGLDAFFKERFAEILKKLKEQGTTIIMVTHDTDFAAEVADTCAMLFKGEITSINNPVEFFSENNFYTTNISRMTRGLLSGIITFKKLTDILPTL